MLVVPVAVYYTVGREHRPTLLPIGTLLPGIPVSNDEGKNILTDSLLPRRGMVVIFSTECDHCEELMKRIDTMFPEIQSWGEVLPVSLDDAAATRRFAEKHQLTVPLYSDGERRSLPLWNVRTVPSMIVVSEHRRVMNIRSGNIRPEELRRLMGSAPPDLKMDR